jgi:hypothetical protein
MQGMPSQEKPQKSRDMSEIQPQTIPAGGLVPMAQPPARGGEDTGPKAPFRVGG